MATQYQNSVVKCKNYSILEQSRASNGSDFHIASFIDYYLMNIKFDEI